MENVSRRGFISALGALTGAIWLPEPRRVYSFARDLSIPGTDGWIYMGRTGGVGFGGYMLNGYSHRYLRNNGRAGSEFMRITSMSEAIPPPAETCQIGPMASIVTGWSSHHPISSVDVTWTELRN